MLLATTWRDLRWRTAAGVLMAAPFAAFVTASFAVQRSQGPGALPGVIALGRSYHAYVDTAWFHLPSPSFLIAFVAILVTAGGILVRPRAELAFLLALPISRWAWVLAHVGGSVAATALIALTCAAILLVGGWWQGTSYPVLRMLVNSAVVVLAAVPWITTTAAVLTFVRRPALAIMLVLGVVAIVPGSWFGLDIPASPQSSLPAAWELWALADPRLWHRGPPLHAILTSTVVVAAGLAAALLRVQRIDV